MEASTTTNNSIAMVAAERRRHVALGYDASHDIAHPDSELTAAALCYAVASDAVLLDPDGEFVVSSWPWPDDKFRPADTPLDNLVRAASLLCAEIDRRLLLRESSGSS